MISKEDSLMFKGVALLLMLIFHLWNPFLPETPLRGTIGWINEPAAAFGSICVSIFVFLSGYGLMASHACRTWNDVCKKIKKLYVNYWKIWIIFVPIFLFLGCYSFNVWSLLLEFFMLEPYSNGMFWFLYLYVELLIGLYIFNRISFNRNWGGRMYLLFLLLGFTYSVLVKGGPLSRPQIARFFEYAPCFLSGILCYEKALFYKKTTIKKWQMIICLLAIVLFRAWLFYSTPLYVKKYADSIIVPILIYLTLNIGVSHIFRKYMCVIGKYSMGMWLTHGYIFFYYPNLIYWPRYSVLQFLWFIAISLLMAYITDKFWLISKKIVNNHVV